MHHSLKGITVQVISEGTSLKFYEDPDEDPRPRTRQYHVESFMNAVFKVRVALTKDFPLYCLRHDDGVRCSINYDGQKLELYRDFSTLDLSQCWNRGQPAEHTFSRLYRYCNDSQQWKSGETTFGALSTSGLFLVPSFESTL